jgi:tetratricopeptide (TPR) repeat protein
VEQVEDQPLQEPDAIPQPKTAGEYQLRGYAYYAKGDFAAAQADFQEAVALAPTDVESVYALGLAYKVQGRAQEGARAFQKVLDLIHSGAVEDSTRAEMLGRLAKGHLNMMTIGDWNLEKEIWKRSD